MTLMCIERSQSPTHKGSFLQGRKSPVNNNNNINQQNANHHRRNSCSPPLSKNHHQQQQQQDVTKSQNVESRKLERSASEPDRRAVQSNSSRYKTELCRPFEESGTCKYGDKCQFAHGVKELRSMARHPKYKTELCRTFHSTGLCPYGPRCHFIHNSEQSKKSLLTNLTSTVPVTPSVSRPKALSSLGSAGDISPVSSHAGTPTVSKSFDDLYQQPPMSPINQALLNLNHPNFNFSPVDCLPEAPQYFIFSDDGLSASDSNLDNYGYHLGLGGLDVSVFNTVPDDFFSRLSGFPQIQSKQ